MIGQVTDPPPPPEHRAPPPPPQQWAPPTPTPQPPAAIPRPSAIAPAPPKKNRTRDIIIAAIAISLAGGLVAWAFVASEQDELPEPSEKARLTAAFADELSTQEDVDVNALVDAVRPLADSVCTIARDADDVESFGTLIGISWFANEESLSRVFRSSRSYTLFAAAAVDWRCASQAQRLGL